MLGISDAGIVSSLADASLLVVQPRRLPRSMLLRVKNALNDIGATVLGVVLNNVDLRHDHQYRLYTTYGDYYAKAASDGNRCPRRALQKADTESSKPEDEY